MTENKEDTEALLKLALSAPTEEIKEEEPLSEVHQWVLAAGIRPGEAIVPAMLIYETYRKWTDEPINRWAFFMQLAKIFVPCRTGQIRYYKLDPAPFNLSTEHYFMARRAMQKYLDIGMYAKNKKEAKEEASETPCPQEENKKTT